MRAWTIRALAALAAGGALALLPSPLRAAAQGESRLDPAGLRGCAARRPEWIWCDDFETDRIGFYFEYDSAGGRFTRRPGVGRDGSFGMRAQYVAGVTNSGHLSLAMGRTPHRYFRPVDEGRRNYRELYWRLYLRLEPGWSGGGGAKLTRAIVFAAPSWAEAAIAHVWSGTARQGNGLMLDPASGTDSAGALRTTRYNDFPNLTWIGLARGRAQIFDPRRAGAWVCIEAHARLNDPGQANGIFELWIDGESDAARTGLNFLGRYADYGFNALNVENWWNDGAPRNQERYFDDLVVSTARIGC